VGRVQPSHETELASSGEKNRENRAADTRRTPRGAAYAYRVPRAKPAGSVPATLAALRVPVAQLQPYRRNPRRGNLALLRESLAAHGQYRPLVVNRRTMEVLAGNHTFAAALDLGWEELAVTYVDVDEEEAARIVLVDNRSNDQAGYDEAMLAELLASLPTLDATGYDSGELDALLASLNGGGPSTGGGLGALSERFLIPPFSVLDARRGDWQQRKQAWLALGIESELGREADLLDLRGPAERQARYFKHAVPQNKEIQTRHYYDSPSARLADAARLQRPDAEPTFAGTSVFDPVLCELAYRWFSPPASAVLDPFAGGSVRGIVASRLGRAYTGIELRAAQIAANEPQADRLAEPACRPRWLEGDARELEQLLGAGELYDLVFSCPPYFDLEVYSNDPRDLSRASGYEEFAAAHAQIIAAACGRLRPDRFAVWVVSEIREQGGDGNCRGLIADTERAFRAAGLELYNEAVLVTPVGSLPIRAGRHFSGARKLGRTHQNVLVFAKGSARAAAEACGPVEVDLTAWELEEAARELELERA
jgi:ParB-like chromosome segregation protein Spo0J